jgi:NAD-dependent dihydropyrimidine dehydrogenase PreA subunit
LISINLGQCSGCGACVEVCPYRALYLVDGKAMVDGALCRNCQADAAVCISACPTEAIVLTEQTQELAPVPTRTPAIQPAPQVIQVNTETSLGFLQTRVMPAIGTALVWTAREIVPRLAYSFLDGLDRRTAQRRVTGRTQRASNVNGQAAHGGGRRHRRRRWGS